LGFNHKFGEEIASPRYGKNQLSHYILFLHYVMLALSGYRRSILLGNVGLICYHKLNIYVRLFCVWEKWNVIGVLSKFQEDMQIAGIVAFK